MKRVPIRMRIAVSLLVGTAWLYTAEGSITAPPICEACAGPGSLERHEGLNWGYEDCQTVWRNGQQVCEEAGITEDCEGL